MTEDKQKYIVIENFEKFQHYKDLSRPIAWIKLYLKLLDSYRFAQLSDACRWCFVGMLLLSAKKNNMIPYDLKWVQGQICHPATTPISFNDYIKEMESQGLIAIKMLSKRYHSAILEKSREDKEKRREEKIEKVPLSFNQLYALKGTIFDDQDVEIIRVFCKLGFKCIKGEEKDLAKWLEEITAEFNTVDQMAEIKKFEEWWENQNRKLKVHKLAWRNWLTNSIEFKKNREK